MVVISLSWRNKGSNVEVNGAGRRYRSATGWTAGLELHFINVFTRKIPDCRKPLVGKNGSVRQSNEYRPQNKSQSGLNCGYWKSMKFHDWHSAGNKFIVAQLNTHQY